MTNNGKKTVDSQFSEGRWMNAFAHVYYEAEAVLGFISVQLPHIL